MSIRIPLGFLLLVLGAPLLGQEGAAGCPPCEPPAPPPEPAWKTGVGLAYLATTGNSETETFGLDVAVTRRPEPWGLDLAARYDRTEDAGVERSERALVAARAKRVVAERWDLFGEASCERDRHAGLDLRLLMAAGATLHALRAPAHALDFDLGATWTDEDRVAPFADESSFGALLGLRYEWQLSERASLGQRLVWYPNLERSARWRAESLTALQAALTDRLALRVGYDVRYVHQPVPGRDDTDTSSRLALVLNF